MNLEGRVALITGGAVRLGRSAALALAGRGCHIVIHYNRSGSPAALLRDEINASGGTAWLVSGDLAGAAVCERIVLEAKEQAGRLDILVNNAGVFNQDPLGGITEENLMAEFWPNCFAPIFLVQAFARATTRGRIINFLDQRISGHDERGVAYQLSKKALQEFTCLAAKALAPGITVNAIAPGAILPPAGENVENKVSHAGPPLLEAHPVPEDIVEALLYLVQSDVLTGQVIFVDSGQMLT